MSTAADDVRAWLQAQPQLDGWRIQFGRWVDGGTSDRYAVLRPVGGMPASLTREPRFTLLLVAAMGYPETAAYSVGNALIEASRVSRGNLVSLRIGEPVSVPVSDGRPAVELAINTITD